jgi:hypothetical protein
MIRTSNSNGDKELYHLGYNASYSIEFHYIREDTIIREWKSLLNAKNGI